MRTDLGEEQADQLARHLLGAGWYAVQVSGKCVLGRDGVGILHEGESWRDAFHLAGADLPERGRFVGHGTSVLRGEESVAVTRSGSMARRIAAALNLYKPGARGY